MEWGAILSGILAIAGALLKMWMDNAPVRAKETVSDEKEKTREAIASGDAVALGAAIDSVPSPTGDTSGQSTDQDISRRLAEITGG